MSGSPSGLVPPTNNSSLGLGATGGPRGFAAGVTQVLVNFLLNYQRGNIDQISQDIKQLQVAALKANSDQETAVNRLARGETKLNELAAARFKLERAGTPLSKLALDLQKEKNAASQVGLRLSTSDQALRKATLQSLITSGVLTRQEVELLNREFSITQGVARARGQATTATQANTAAQQTLNGALQLQATLQNQAKAGLSRIGALGIGLVGGTLGGALVSGLALGPLQAGLEGATTALGQFLEPAKAAKEAVDRLAESVNAMAEERNISRLEAAAEILERISQIQPVGSGSLNTPENRQLLETLALNEKLTPELQAQADLLGAQAGLVGQLTDENRQLLEFIIRRRIILGDTTPAMDAIIRRQQDLNEEGGRGFDIQVAINEIIDQEGDGILEAFRNTADLNDEAADTAAALEAAANAAASLADELARAAVEAAATARIDSLKTGLDSFVDAQKASAEAAIDSIRAGADEAADRIRSNAESRIDRLQNRLRNIDSGPSRRTQGLENRLDNLSDDPSARTKRLQSAIEDLTEAQDKRRYKEQLADIDEEKRLVLLRERLRLSKDAINIDEFSGKARLVAIDALLDRQRKQNEVQERFNKLLDIQYQLSQGVRRQQGETIREFIERRAQYYRGLLQQAAELNREGPAAELEAERQRVEASVELKELEERRRKLIEDKARQERLKSLQDQLQASQERDRRELELRREMLQKQLEASRNADQAALDSRRQALQDQIEATRENAAKEIDKINERRDADIAAREQSRDRAIAAAQRVAELAIAAEERRSEAIQKFSSQAETQRLIDAFNGAQSLAQLQWFSGQLSGAVYALGYLQQSGQYTGLDPQTQARILGNIGDLIRSYQNNLGRIYRQSRGFADGGMFMLNNSNTPVGGDIRWGDGQGDEIGVVLSNKVTQALRESTGAGNALVGGDMIINTGEDPYMARYKWRREVADIVDAKLAGRSN